MIILNLFEFSLLLSFFDWDYLGKFSINFWFLVKSEKETQLAKQRNLEERNYKLQEILSIRSIMYWRTRKSLNQK